MNQKTLISIGVILIVGISIGCGEKEDKDILDARLATGEGDYSAVQSAVERALSNNPKQTEAQSLQLLLRLRSTSDPSAWQSGLEQVLSHLKPLNEDIQEISNREDPDSDDLDRQERLIRSRNSISGFMVDSFAEAARKQPNLLSDLVNQANPVIITALLEGKKCFQTASRETAARLIQGATKNDAVIKLLIQAIQHDDPHIAALACLSDGGGQRLGAVTINDIELRRVVMANGRDAAASGTLMELDAAHRILPGSPAKYEANPPTMCSSSFMSIVIGALRTCRQPAAACGATSRNRLHGREVPCRPSREPSV